MDFNDSWRLIGGGENFANRKDAAKTVWDEHPEKHSACLSTMEAHWKDIARETVGMRAMSKSELAVALEEASDVPDE